MAEKHYLVTWGMDFFCENPYEAAKKALEEMRNSYSSATCFTVKNVDKNDKNYNEVTEFDLENI